MCVCGGVGEVTFAAVVVALFRRVVRWVRTIT